MEKMIIEMEQHIKELESALILMYNTMNNTELFKKLMNQKLNLQYELELLKRSSKWISIQKENQFIG